MLDNNQTIPCPVCHTSIPFDVQALIQGLQFACPNCSATVGISNQSIDSVKDSMQKLDELKKKKP